MQTIETLIVLSVAVVLASLAVRALEPSDSKITARQVSISSTDSRR